MVFARSLFTRFHSVLFTTVNRSLSKEEVKKNTEKYLNIFKDYPYIFNLGHGVLPEIKPEMIAYVVDLVRSSSK